MTKEQLIASAKTFGIETEGLTVAQLKTAIAASEAAANAKNGTQEASEGTDQTGSDESGEGNQDETNEADQTDSDASGEGNQDETDEADQTDSDESGEGNQDETDETDQTGSDEAGSNEKPNIDLPTIKFVTEETPAADAIEEFQSIDFSHSNGDQYKITVPKFSYKGNLYQSAEAAEQTPELIEELIEAKAFIIKKV